MIRGVLGGRQIGAVLGTGAGAADVATYSVTTTGAQTHTIKSLGIVAPESVTVTWGDGGSDVYNGTALRTHNYAGAGTWTVTITHPEFVETFDIRDNKVNLDSAGIASMVNIVTFIALTLRSGTFDSVDVSAWRPTHFYLFSMPTGYVGTFDSVDVSAWRPTHFYLSSMPAGYVGTFDSVDVSAWRPASFYLLSMPAGYVGTFDSVDVSAWRLTSFYLFSMPAGYAFVAGGGFANWTTTTNFQMQNNALIQAQVDAILWELYQASATPRTGVGGTINLGGTNAAPSGVFQPAAACPVNVATPGREVAHELLNDGCAVGFNVWAAVTIN